MSLARSPITAYLDELAARLPSSQTTQDLLQEARDHLLTATTAGEQEGMDRVAAEQRAVDEFGPILVLEDEFRRVILATDSRRQALWQLAVAIALACCGVSVFRLIPWWRGEISDLFPAPPVAFVGCVTVLAPSLTLLSMSYAPALWNEAHGLTWLYRARAIATALFVVGLPLCLGLVADEAARLVGGSYSWLVVAAVGALVVARSVVPSPARRSRLGSG